MGAAKTGTEFIKHEFDEAIAIQHCFQAGQKETSTSLTKELAAYAVQIAAA